MKVKTVSALRSKRGLHRVNGAEPQVVGLTPQTTDERKTDTMKTYILRDRQTCRATKINPPARPKPAAATAKSPVLFIGLDVHNDSIAVSLAPSDSPKCGVTGSLAANMRTCSSWPKNWRRPIPARP